ncbi:MAG: sugar transferase [Acidobacteriota bacterium]
MNPYSRTSFGLRLAGDLLAGAIAFRAAFWLRMHVPLPFTQFLLPPDRLDFFYAETWAVLLSQTIALYFFGLYDPPSLGRRSEWAGRLLAAVTLQTLVLMGYYFLTNATFPRSVLLLFALLDLPLLYLCRRVLVRLRPSARRRVAVVGTGPAARELATTIQAHGGAELELAGFVPSPEEAARHAGSEALRNLDSEAEAGDPDGNDQDETEFARCLGTVEDLPGLLRSGAVDDVILADEAGGWRTRLLDQLTALGPKPGSVLMLPGPFDSLIGRMRYRWVRDLPLIEVVRESEWRYNRPAKRSFDLITGALLLLLSSPALLLGALLVKLTSPGPVFYRQTRVGLGRRPIVVWKLRTMKVDAERLTGEVLAAPGDPRLTLVGGWLRRYRWDELPQLFNVLGGSMSLVGPRPERPTFVDKYLQEVPGYAERYSVPPGVTGLAQINGGYHSSAQNKLRYDLAYIANWSLWLDLAILFQTVKIVLTSRGT